MHICVVGDGVSGLMSANFFAGLYYIEKVTLIGSPKIPTIGVGESTTLNFEVLHKLFDLDLNSFIKESDASVKLGVMYSNWSKRDFLHHFKMPSLYQKYNLSAAQYSGFLGNKDKNTHIHDLIASKLYKDAKKNLIPYTESNPLYANSWHFDAGKYISYLKKLAKNHRKIIIVDDTVTKCNFNQYEYIDSIILDSNTSIHADYFVICTGQNSKTNDLFKIKYHDISDVLLTNKALFFPKEYTDKKKEFHPYTIAKTMKNGWRWITPTWSRVGTGYVFSDHHITVDQAIEEFQEEIGNSNIIPNVVDFYPRYSVSTFNQNYITLGMCGGFLEPLDAPGLSISSIFTMTLGNIFRHKNIVSDIKNKTIDPNYWADFNCFAKELYEKWACFILTQYKTSHRNDTQFWIDHKNIDYQPLSEIIENLDTSFNFGNSIKDKVDHSNSIIKKLKKEIFEDFILMIQQTISSKDIQWNTTCDIVPFELDDSTLKTISHYDFIEKIHLM